MQENESACQTESGLHPCVSSDCESHPPDDIRKGSIRNRQNKPFPPRLLWWQLGIVILCSLVVIITAGYIVDQFCLSWCPSSVCLTYVASGIFLCVLILQRYVLHDIYVHQRRLEDPSLVQAAFVESRNVLPRLFIDGKPKPDDYVPKKDALIKEIERLEQLGKKGWTDFQVLPVELMLVDFLKIDDLIARAAATIVELEEYAESSAYRYDRQQLGRWEERVKEAKTLIGEAKGTKTENSGAPPEDEQREKRKMDCAAQRLRAELRALLDNVRAYKMDWTRGSVLIKSIMTYGVPAILLLILMGLLPVIHPSGDGIIRILNWGLLGASGSLAGTLFSLRKSDLVEVGNTEGSREVWNTVLGTTLGFMAGILMHSLIAGEVLGGTGLPTFPKGLTAPTNLMTMKDIGLSIIWAIGAGYSFEWVFSRLRGSTTGDAA